MYQHFSNLIISHRNIYFFKNCFSLYCRIHKYILLLNEIYKLIFRNKPILIICDHLNITALVLYYIFYALRLPNHYK